MPRYLDMAAQLKSEVDSFLKAHVTDAESTKRLLDNPIQDAAVQLGHIINLAVRCNPRQPQGTVRGNIVAKAMESYCRVHMTKEYDEKTQREFNKIHISYLPIK